MAHGAPGFVPEKAGPGSFSCLLCSAEDHLPAPLIRPGPAGFTAQEAEGRPPQRLRPGIVRDPRTMVR